MRLQYMPVGVSLKERFCLIVGGGAEALQKVERLLEYDTSITVVAPQVHEKLEYHAERGRIGLERREYESPEAAGFGLVVSTTNDAALNARVHKDAKEGGALVNVVDDLELSDFIFPAVLRRDCLTAAIATDGRAPFISGHLRLVLDNIFPNHWARLMRLAASFRSRVRSRWAGQRDKQDACYAEFLEADWKAMFAELEDGQIDDVLTRMLESAR